MSSDIEVEVRRNCIRRIAIDSGFTSVKDLQGKLKEMDNIEVSLDVIYDDLRLLKLYRDADYDVYANRILGNCEDSLCNLDKMSKLAKYENQRIKAVDSYFRNAVEMIRLINLVRGRKVVKEVDESDEKDGDVVGDGEEVEIKFK